MPAVAGILDPYGGFRVIIGTLSEMQAATRIDELCLIVDGMDEGDPPIWERVPYIVATVERHVAWWIRTRNDPELPRPAKLYQIKSRKTDRKRVIHLDDIVMG